MTVPLTGTITIKISLLCNTKNVTVAFALFRQLTKMAQRSSFGGKTSPQDRIKCRYCHLILATFCIGQCKVFIFNVKLFCNELLLHYEPNFYGVSTGQDLYKKTTKFIHNSIFRNIYVPACFSLDNT